MILVTGASGNVGKAVLQEVAKSGAKHRAMYRSAAEATKAPPGTETVIADFAKKDTLAKLAVPEMPGLIARLIPHARPEICGLDHPGR